MDDDLKEMLKHMESLNQIADALREGLLRGNIEGQYQSLEDRKQENRRKDQTVVKGRISRVKGKIS